jgi:hypothetical protein
MHTKTAIGYIELWLERNYPGTTILRDSADALEFLMLTHGDKPKLEIQIYNDPALGYELVRFGRQNGGFPLLPPDTYDTLIAVVQKVDELWT